MKPKNKEYPWDNSKIILLCGVGGVGKTTLSAAIAVDYALQGYKTIVLTVDPAKRLAQALGLDEISAELQSINLAQDNKEKIPVSLDAMMLNTKRTFDKIINKYAPDQRTKDAILNHPLYKHLSNMLAGSQEYMAMEDLYQIATEQDYEKIVVDTPPSRHALDFLDAPQKMVNAITNSMLKILVRPSVWAGKKGSKLMRVFGNLAGIQFLQELSDLLSSTISLLDGFKDRAKQVTEIMGNAKIVLVTTPTPSTITDATDFIRSIESRNLTLAGSIVNRATPRATKNTQLLKEIVVWCKNQRNKDLITICKEIEFLGKQYRLENRLVTDFKRRVSDMSFYILPNTSESIHNINGLQKLYSSLSPA